jgi:hypothetical protein
VLRDDIPQAKLDGILRDFEEWVLAEEVKTGLELTEVDLDDPYSFAFNVREGKPESDKDRRHRLELAEEYVRAWLVMRGAPRNKIPLRQVGIYKLPVHARFPDSNGEAVDVEGKIVDVEYDYFADDPLLILQNTLAEPKVDLIEVHLSQVTSFWPKDMGSMFKLVRPSLADEVVEENGDEPA